MADPPPHHCKDCGLVFDSGKSLDVHLHYHKENLLSKWAQQPSSDESNNNHVKKSRPTATAADSSESAGMMSAHQVDRYYHHSHSIGNSSSYVSPTQQSQEDPGFVLGSGAGFPQLARTPTPNSCSSPSPHHQTVPTSNSYRYHPYHQYSHAPSPDHHRNGMVSSSSPQQCDKCGFVCESGAVLMEHLSVAHPPTPNSELYNRPDVQSIKHEAPDIFNRHDVPSIKSEQSDLFNQSEIRLKSEPGGSQAEILDLDSHKVHVYQPPTPQEHSVSALLSWVNNVPEKDRFQPHNGSGLASPDCYSGVSTTTLTPPDPNDMLPHQQSTYQFDHISHLGTNNHQQISSSQMPHVANQHNQQNKIMKSGNGSWKANDARRPKTYNCSACNKWFTSSGHLKRHYNTTLHKNAVKQSGVPDPATMPISSHHHPHKDPTYLSPQSPADSIDEPQQQPQQTQQQQQQPTPPAQQQHQQPQHQQQPPPHLMNHHHFLPSPPNLMAGPSEVTGGLLLHTAPYQEVTSPTPNPPPSATFLPFPPTPTYPLPQHPNFQPPHVSTDPQVTTSSISGNLNVLDIANYLLDSGKRETQLEQVHPLPSFAQFQHTFAMPNFSSFHPVVSSSDNNVGGLCNDRISSNYESLYQPSQSPLEDTYSMDNIGSIETAPFGSPDGSSSSGGDVKPCFPSPTDHPSSTDQQVETSTLRPVKKIRKKVKVIKMEENSVSSTNAQSPPPDLIDPLTVRSEISTPLHKCVDCDKVFNKACYLTQHNKSFHSGLKPYKCERCGKRFTAEYLHQEHISKHAGDKPYKCEICPKQFNHKTDLRRHMCLHTGDKPYACEVCGKGFIRKDHMIKHCETHKRRPSQNSHLRFNKQQLQNTALIESLKQQNNNNHMQQLQQQFHPQPQAVLSPPLPTTVIASTAHNRPPHSLQMVM